MYALVNYKGNQILLEEGKKIKIPYQKDLKAGSTLNFDQVVFYHDGKKKHIGSPFLKSTNFQAKVDSHSKETKVVVFKKKRRKGHQKKNGHKQPFTLIHVDKLQVKKAASSKKTTAQKKGALTKKPSTSKKTTAAKKTTTKKTKK